MNASVHWHHGLSFTGTADSGFTLNLGTDPGVGGDDDGFRPMELILIGLAGCTSMDVMSILQKKRQTVTGFDVKVDTERSADHPKVFTYIHIHYLVQGSNIDPKAVERAIELSRDKYCPASAMLSKAATIEHTFEVLTAE